MDDASVTESSSNWGLISVDPAIPKDVLKEDGSALEVKGTSPSFSALAYTRCIYRLIFGGLAFTTDNFQVKCIIYLTEQFDALRQVCRCEQDMLRSLSRCIKWNASGGKSGSLFLKTRGILFHILRRLHYTDSVQDERFIAKEISRFEGDSFGEIGPAYFSYLSTCFTTGVRRSSSLWHSVNLIFVASSDRPSLPRSSGSIPSNTDTSRRRREGTHMLSMAASRVGLSASI